MYIYQLYHPFPYYSLEQSSAISILGYDIKYPKNAEIGINVI